MAIYVACNNKPYLGPRVRVTDFRMSRPIFKKVSNTKYRENASRESQADTLGQTDENDEGNRRFLEYTDAPKSHCRFQIC